MRQPLVQHEGIAAVLLRDNIDTDQIIPSREMKQVSRAGLGEGLFAGWRYLEPGGRAINPEFVLNRPEQTGTSILIAGENFGCGSSREHAVWALEEYGIRVILAKSFGEIFHGNCVRNGILPITLSAEDIDALAAGEQPVSVSVDLGAQTVRSEHLRNGQIEFEIGAFAKRLLIEGLDPIALTLTEQDQIDAFLDRDTAQRPWVYSAA
ncbi:MAG: 3-isopropylmalate dehydratase small subunit [Henriciella sp.]|nr:3-isopropylmalate dehydratase small subunit [Henriciella sp.]